MLGRGQKGADGGSAGCAEVEARVDIVPAGDRRSAAFEGSMTAMFHTCALLEKCSRRSRSAGFRNALDAPPEDHNGCANPSAIGATTVCIDIVSVLLCHGMGFVSCHSGVMRPPRERHAARDQQAANPVAWDDGSDQDRKPVDGSHVHSAYRVGRRCVPAKLQARDGTEGQHDVRSTAASHFGWDRIE